jgi:plastocyanin
MDYALWIGVVRNQVGIKNQVVKIFIGGNSFLLLCILIRKDNQMKNIKSGLYYVVILVSVIIFSSCSKNSSYGSSNNQPANASVNIANMAYDPATLHIQAGATVTWTNNDNMDHTVTADDSSFYSPTIPTGGKYTHTFSSGGTFPYHCVIHPGMKATVTTN